MDATANPAAPALDEFRRLRRESALTPADAERLARQAAALFKDYYVNQSAYLDDAITLLAELATHPDPALARVGTAHLFPELVEWSADWFNPDYCRLYDRLFAQVIEICRGLPQDRELNFTLHGYGIANMGDMLARRERLRAPRPPFDPAAERVQKIVVLSRVTFGAEVAVTSVILRGVAQRYPEAERVLLGAPVVAQLFAGEPGLRVQDARYPRGGSLLDRLSSWPALTQIVADELAGLDSNQFLIIDPDSRLTQLGLLPLTSDESRYLFFESRSYGSDAETEAAQGARISQLTARWLDEQFRPAQAEEGGEATLPFVNLAVEHQALTRALREALNDGRPLVGVSFGVGGNEAKRVGTDFEADLLRALCAAGARVLLVKGVGAEVARAEQHLDSLRRQGLHVHATKADWPRALPGASQLRRADVIGWEGELGAFCAVIAAADVYVGYDSGGSHIAAAQGVPVVDVFADDSIPMVTTRWTPTGPAPVHVVAHYEAPTETLDRVMAAYHACVAGAPQP